MVSSSALQSVNISYEILVILYAFISLAICMLSVYCLIMYLEIRVCEAQKKREKLDRKIMGKSRKRYIDYYAKYAHKDILFTENFIQPLQPQLQLQSQQQGIATTSEFSRLHCTKEMTSEYYMPTTISRKGSSSSTHHGGAPLLLANQLPFIQQQENAILINCRSMAAAALSSAVF